MLCKLEELKLNAAHDNTETKKSREKYAKIALLMFCPHRKLGDLMIGGSYWKLFTHELKNHRDDKETLFWSQGFRILQNIEDCMTMDKNSRRATDRVTNSTECMAPEDYRYSAYCKPNKCNGMDYVLD